MRASLLLMLGLALPCCALLGKSEPLVPRYFTPEYDGAAATTAAPPGLQLRLGRVEGWSHLRERMVARNASRELTFHEERRWTEQPEVYLRRALARALFEERGVTESLSGRAVTLDVELIAFEELEQPHLARLQALMVLRDERVGLLEETVTVEQPIEQGAHTDPAAAVAEALSQSLRLAVSRIAERTVARLASQPAREPAASATSR